MTTPSADLPDLPDVRMDGAARDQGRLYQAARDQTVNQITQQVPRRPLPEAGTVQVPVGLAGLPRRPAAAFVGRDTALTALRQALQEETGPGVISQAVLGLGGVGKSELALQYAHRHRQEYRLVWWIDADGPEQIRAGLAALARALACGIDSVAAEQATIEEAAAWALSWLAAHPGWLVIFDNVDEVAHVEPYLGQLAHGHILITTRRDIGWRHLRITPLRLELLSRPAAIALLADLIGPPDAANADALEELAEHLGDLPLALTQAGAYIARTPRMTLSRYLELLKDIPARMYATATSAGGDAERVVAKVLTLSHARIQAINPLAIRVLNLLACYAPDNLPCSVPDGLPETDPLQVGEALALLASYSLITLTPSPVDLQPGEPEDLVSVHRLIQAVTLHHLSPDQRESVRRKAADLLLTALPGNPEKPSNWPAYRALLPHARVVLPLDSWGLRQVVAYLGASSDYTTAINLQQQIHAHAVNARGSEHPDALNAQHHLAHWTGEAGDAAAARDQIAALLSVEERVLGSEYPDTLTTRQSLAHWIGRAGDAAAARDQLAALLPICEHVHGANHPATLTTRNHLIRWTGQVGDAATARDQCTVLLPIQERVLGAEHLDTLNTRHHLAHWIGEAGDAATARDQLAALLSVEERVLGAEHFETLLTRHHFASWTGQAGDAAAARDLYAALVPICERMDGVEHPDTLTTRHNLASWTGQAGDAAAARDLYAALLPIREHVHGAEHPSTLATRHQLASWTGEAGDAAAARDQLAALLPIREHVHGAEHPSTLGTRHNLAGWTGEAGDAAAARDQLAALLPIRERVLGTDHPSTLTTRHNLASWTGEAGDAAAARDQYAALLPIEERVLGSEHPDALTTRHNLACWTGRAGDAAAARDQLAALLPIRERVLGTDHPSTLTTRRSLARWTGKVSDAESRGS
ncbi:FxSxx-COOH system tetratricopeptide repeat protein [Nonomuraea turcica]|uniref:FxSxx-COOH system tetratricopeptide repeat protein n=2 Tax=Nonomuraea TaxID=83681 RepID=UPI00273A8581|nr:FxSxx-COOH system tetratricopeptide repeat protein [Nonomuraea sp. G32]MDP4510261.1 FxSxx-COOH system tetratricopeptide repeat protein [Nonomuraea sp. G32]